MAKASVEVQNLMHLERTLLRLGRAAPRIVGKAVKKGSEFMLSETQKRAPVDTGLLKSSLTVLPLKRKRGRVGFRVGYTNVEQLIERSTSKEGKRFFYPAVVEYGGKTPFMRPAFDAGKNSAQGIILHELKSGIARAARKQSIAGRIEKFGKKTGLTKFGKKLSKRIKKTRKSVSKGLAKRIKTARKSATKFTKSMSKQTRGKRGRRR